MHIVCVGSFAPYLGGPETWGSLQSALAPHDRLDIVGPLSIVGKLHTADLVNAHAASASVSIAACARSEHRRPLVLVAPICIGLSRGNAIVGNDARSRRDTRFLREYGFRNDRILHSSSRPLFDDTHIIVEAIDRLRNGDAS